VTPNQHLALGYEYLRRAEAILSDTERAPSFVTGRRDDAPARAAQWAAIATAHFLASDHHEVPA
jgi:hypothetical protein